MRAHYVAVKNRLLADAALASRGVHDTALVEAVTGLPVVGTYTILLGGAPDSLDDDRLASPQMADSDAEYVYTVRAVSSSADGVRSTSQKVFAQLVGFAPTVAGRSCSRIEFDSANEPRPDFSVNPPLYWADQTFTLRSSRA